MAYDSTAALEAVKTKHPEAKIVSMTEMPSKFIFEYAAPEDEMLFGIAMDTFYSVDKNSGEVYNYTPYEEENPDSFFDAPQITINE